MGYADTTATSVFSFLGLSPFPLSIAIAEQWLDNGIHDGTRHYDNPYVFFSPLVSPLGLIRHCLLLCPPVSGQLVGRSHHGQPRATSDRAIRLHARGASGRGGMLKLLRVSTPDCGFLLVWQTHKSRGIRESKHAALRKQVHRDIARGDGNTGFSLRLSPLPPRNTILIPKRE